ncbi:hypothetical protein CMUS01_11276 [Colletotrichum musicola]|uniref:Uncharacterized protein n=1 Tax=Colletotrichum musicola TaxID=2175873 RepID=A0A8H6JZH6_9PEZI|nr:hypothetical protein CMUS01_11276 [Colletotrichum musicola]
MRLCSRTRKRKAKRHKDEGEDEDSGVQGLQKTGFRGISQFAKGPESPNSVGFSWLNQGPITCMTLKNWLKTLQKQKVKAGPVADMPNGVAREVPVRPLQLGA